MRRVLLSLSALLLPHLERLRPPTPRRPRTAGSSRPGRVAGAGGALFRTDVWLFNPDEAATATATLVFHPAVTSGQAAPAARSPRIRSRSRRARRASSRTSRSTPCRRETASSARSSGGPSGRSWRRPHLHVHAHGDLRVLPSRDPALGVDDAPRRATDDLVHVAPDLRHQLGRRELPDEPRRHEYVERHAARSRSASSTGRPRSTAARGPTASLRARSFASGRSSRPWERRSRTACASRSRSPRGPRCPREASSRPPTRSTTAPRTPSRSSGSGRA